MRLKTPDGHPLQGGYPVVSCSRCGCGFANVRTSPSYYRRYYETLAKYADEATMLRSKSNALQEAVWVTEKSDREAARIAELVPSRDARILDIGCGGGSLLGALKRAGYQDVFGIEPSPTARAQAEAAWDVPVAVGTLEALPSEWGRFDCICLTGVLEHVWDVDSAVEALGSVLRPDGVVYIEVPDGARYLSPYLAPFEDFNTEHVNHFSLSTLRVLGGRFRYAPVFEESYEAWLTEDAKTAVAAMAWKRDAAGGHEVVDLDEDLEKILQAYAMRSQSDLDDIDSALAQELATTDSFILWGVGELTFKLLALPSLSSRNPVAYVDTSEARQRFTFDGIPVSRPGDLVSGSTPIVISSFLRANSIVASAHQHGLQNQLVRLDTLRSSPNRP